MEGWSVLVVEDDAMIRHDAVSVLQEAGLDVIEADCVEDALALLWDRSPSVAAVFTDVRMPGHSDGFDLVGLIGRHWPKMAVLITSGIVSEPKQLPHNARFFPKPWIADEIINILKTIIRTLEGEAEVRTQRFQMFSGMRPPE